MTERAGDAFHAANATALATGQHRPAAPPEPVALIATPEPLRRLQRQGHRARPHEACWLLGGTFAASHARLTHVLRLQNCGRGSDRFECCPLQFLRRVRALQRRGLHLLGFAHSHPDGTAWPSAIDRRELWRGHLHVITAPHRDGSGAIAAFDLDAGGRFRPLPIERVSH